MPATIISQEDLIVRLKVALVHSDAQLYFNWLERLPTATPLGIDESHRALRRTYRRCAQYLLENAVLGEKERSVVKSVEARYAGTPE